MSNGQASVVELPQLGESVAEGTIGRWLKQPGERVERDEPLVEIQTDKVNAEVPSPFAGTLERILVAEGETVPVKTAIAEISVAGAKSSGRQITETALEGAGSRVESELGGAIDASPLPTKAADEAEVPAEPSPRQPAFSYDPTPGGGPTSTSWALSHENGLGEHRRFYTPVVLRIAQEHGLDLEQIEGTGLGGRITRKDVERVFAQPRAATAAAGAAPPPGQVAAAPGPLPASAQPTPAEDTVPLTPMRRAIAQHMQLARQTIPDAWTMVEVDVTELARFRQSILDEWQAREGYELTYLPFFIQAVCAGLRSVQELNSTWVEGQGVCLHRNLDLGIAVSLTDGLVVPVLRAADEMNVTGLARGLRSLVQTARGGKLKVEDLQGATFTVNNPGALGSVMSQPVVPVGQTGIVTMEAIVPRVAVVGDGLFGVRQMMNVCLSFDHRVIDGAQALRFLNVVKQRLQAGQFSLT